MKNREAEAWSVAWCIAFALLCWFMASAGALSTGCGSTGALRIGGWSVEVESAQDGLAPERAALCIGVGKTKLCVEIRCDPDGCESMLQ